MKRDLKRLFVPVLLAVAMIGQACSPQEPVYIGRVAPVATYEELYPYYVELSALSQLKPVGRDPGGGAGHAVLYLKGAVIDESVGYPALALCEESVTDLENPDSGVGISVNKIFRNVNWVAIPGKQLFHRGSLEEGERLTSEVFEDTIDDSVGLGIFDGIEIHDQYLANMPDSMAVQEFIARESISTDFALAYGRSIFTVRMPVTREVLGEVIDYLNELNRTYAQEGVDYQWSGYSDNCSHTVHNALAQSSVWSFKSVNDPKWRQFLSLSVPANEFAALAELVNRDPPSSAQSLRRDRHIQDSLMRFGWLPMQHGALLKTTGTWRENDLYDPAMSIFVVEVPLFKNKRRKVRGLFERETSTDLKANLERYSELYRSILDDWKPEGGEHESTARYRSYIEQQLATVEANLDHLEAGPE